MPAELAFHALALEQLDDALSTYRNAAERPPKGWIRALREALGMSAGQLARRAGVSRETIATLERSEAKGTITIASLDKLARAGLPRRLRDRPQAGSVADLRRARALEVARRELAPVAHSMRLEQQGLSAERERRQLERRAQALLAGSPRRLWKD